ncbi:hypothetical protein BOTBODRAFT_29694 [Botryobasidium botryosum FD-172 SS1]|uniref:Uncharacterized protein n=1 Tax=Botryobasidium botryosum (strain FD-172 SS1) TaxID=930990 RepID=A0A067MPM7_BOTB1|nr:hypothetical protein BOTBODRAFT_29694 [Botryobasidium botryosum FD-172 SS1]
MLPRSDGQPLFPLDLHLSFPQFSDHAQVPLNPNSVEGFAHALQQIVSVEIPKVEQLARSVQDGMERAYDPDIDPSQTAGNLISLQVGLASLYSFLKSSGLGSLPIPPSSDPAQPLATSSAADPPTVEALTKQVGEVYARGLRIKEGAGIAMNTLSQETRRG